MNKTFRQLLNNLDLRSPSDAGGGGRRRSPSDAGGGGRRRSPSDAGGGGR
jgi:hypothetical protein